MNYNQSPISFHRVASFAPASSFSQPPRAPEFKPKPISTLFNTILHISSHSSLFITFHHYLRCRPPPRLRVSSGNRAVRARINRGVKIQNQSQFLRHSTQSYTFHHYRAIPHGWESVPQRQNTNQTQFSPDSTRSYT